MSAINLGDHDADALGELLGLVRDEHGEAGLPWPFLQQLKDLIGCDELAFNGVDTVTESHYLKQSLDDTAFVDASQGQRPAEDEGFWRHYWSTCAYHDLSGDHTRVTLTSDFWSVQQWRATGMYSDTGYGFDHELMMCLPDGIGRSLRLIAFRGPGSNFDERDRFLFALLRPHIAEAYRAAMRPRSAAPAELTPRQQQILELVKRGYTNRQIARRMRISEGTVRTHLVNIFSRLKVTSRTAAVTRTAEPVIV